MTDLTERLRSYGPHHHGARLHFEAADELERLQTSLVRLKMQLDQQREYHAAELADVTAERDMWKDTLAQRDRELANARAIDIHSCHDGCTRAGCVAAGLRAEVAGLRAELELRRKSGSATDRLHNLCEGIADHADGSEWSREEWNRMDAENTALRSELGSLISQFHHAMKDAGWHPGRTDDNLCDIIREKGKEMVALRESISAALPYCYYMDPPDGGNVELPEQLLRMGEDAARYRWLRLPRSNVPISHDAARDPVVYDAAIDSARKDTP